MAIHTHVDAHFVLITSGSYVSSARGDPGRAGTLVYNPPGTTHRDNFLDGRGSFFTITIAGDRLVASAEATLQSGPLHLSDPRAAGIARGLLMECARWTRTSPLRAESLSLELIDAASERRAKRDRTAPPWLRRAAELIADSAEDLTVTDIARAVEVHPTHLARVFRAFLGCTPGDLLRARRLDRAASLLFDTKRPIAHIALDCGFTDQAQLTRAFTRTFGLPPGAFRQGRGRPRAPRCISTRRE